MKKTVSKLDLFAMNALPEATRITAKNHLRKPFESMHDLKEVAKLSYDIADAMLVESDKRSIPEKKLRWKKDTSQITPSVPSRCCGRCDGVNDECVADMVCEKHYEQGCEICYGPNPTQ